MRTQTTATDLYARGAQEGHARGGPRENRPFLGWPDICEIFGCGRSKAMLLMHEVGVIHIGRSVFVRASDLDAYLVEHGGIDVDWHRRASSGKRGGTR